MATTIGTSWTNVASKSATVNGAKITFYLDAKRGTQSVANNTTPIDVRLRSVFSGSYMYSYGYNFSASYCTTKSSSSGQWNAATETILTGSKTVSHNSDGTWSGTLTANAKMSGLFDLSMSASVSVPTIPRASTPTFSPSSLDLNGSNSFVITTNRASTSFTHTMSWTVGSKSGTIGSNITDSTTWTPPMSLITEFYSSASIQGTLETKTYNGSTLIGTTTTNFTLKNIGGDAFTVSPSNLTISSRSSNIAINCLTAYSGFGHNIYYKVSGGSQQGISLGSPTFPVNWKPYVSLSQWPTKTTTTCEIIVDTTYNNTVIYNGRKTITITLNVDTSVYKPTISNFTLTEQQTSIASLKDANTFIRYVSDILAKATIGMVADSGSTIKNVKVECGSESVSQTSTSVSTTFTNITGNTVKITAMDTRGVSTTETKAFTLIPYVLLTIAASQERDDPTSDEVIASYNGAYYNGSLGNVNNELTLSYKYREKGQTAWTDGTGSLLKTFQNSTYEGETTLAESFDYTKQYDLLITASDKIMTVSRQLIIYQGIPVWHWGEDHFDVEGDILIHQHEVPTNYAKFTKQAVGIDATDMFYANASLRSLPSGEDTNSYWQSLSNGFYWVGYGTGATPPVPNLPHNYGVVQVMRHGATQYSVVFHAIGVLKQFYKWGNQNDNEGWSQVQMSDDSGWITLNNTAKVYYRKKNGNCTVVINDMNNATLSNGDNLGTLPVGFRPTYTMQQRNSFDNANGRLVVYDSGLVIYGSNVGSANYIRCSITYPVDD